MYIWVARFFWLVVGISFLQAQYAGKVTYGLEEGVEQPGNNYLCDSEGKMWVECSVGLRVFNGKDWHAFTQKEGLLPGRGNPVFEDKEGGIWISHYTYGVSRYFEGRFQQYVAKRPSIDSLSEGQKWYPGPGFLGWFYNKKKEVPVTFFQDSSKQFWMHEYDYATQEFGEAKPFLDQAALEKHAPSMSYLDLPETWLDVDWNGRMCIKQRNNGESYLIYEDGSRVSLPFTNRLKFSSKWWLSDGKGFAAFFQEERDKLWMYQDSIWQLFPAPDLKRYGASYEKLQLSFHSYEDLDDFGSSDEMITIWKVENPLFHNHFIIAEHARYTHEVIRTSMVREDEKVWDAAYMAKDKAGTYWYSNALEVVRLFPDQMYIPTQQQDMPSQIWGVTGTATGKIWFSAYSGDQNLIGLRSFDGLRLEKPTSEIASFYSFSEGGLSDAQGNTYFISNKNLPQQPNEWGILKFQEDESYELLCQGIRGFYLDWDRQGRLMYVTRSNGLWLLPPDKRGIAQADWKKLDKSKGLQIERLRTALQDHHGNYWMGGHREGLAVYKGSEDTIINWIIDKGQINYRIHAMSEDSRGNLWLGTDHGLCFLDNQEAVSSAWDMNARLKAVGEDYFGASPVEVCEWYDEHTLLLGNNQGYYLLDLDAWYAHPGQLFFHPVRQDNGHQGGGIFTNGIWVDHLRDVWMVCRGGALRYSPGLLPKDSLMPAVSIDSLEAGEHIFTDFSQKIKLGATQNTIRIYFSQEVSPLLLDNTRFRFRLSGDKNWSELYDKGWVDYRNLGPGNYTFELLAEKNGLRSPVKKISFRISPLLWQNPWFWLAIFILSGMLVLYFRKKETMISRQNLEIEKTRTEMIRVNNEKEKLQMQAILLTQLNPHFINNALQWLQIRLDDRDDEEGVSVIAKLSENIRSVFTYSRAQKAFHPLVDELKLTENYLFVQKRRFKDKLHYEMPDQARIQALGEVEIPLLMIQIHVENAVEHGIRNKQEPGTLKVSCFQEVEAIVITIEDDGVGRKAAAGMGSTGTGNGTQMLREMQAFYNKQNEQAMSHSYEDGIFEDAAGNTFGTRVTIRLPLNYTYA